MARSSSVCSLIAALCCTLLMTTTVAAQKSGSFAILEKSAKPARPRAPQAEVMIETGWDAAADLGLHRMTVDELTVAVDTLEARISSPATASAALADSSVHDAARRLFPHDKEDLAGTILRRLWVNRQGHSPVVAVSLDPGTGKAEDAARVVNAIVDLAARQLNDERRTRADRRVSALRRHLSDTENRLAQTLQRLQALVEENGAVPGEADRELQRLAERRSEARHELLDAEIAYKLTASAEPASPEVASRLAAAREKYEQVDAEYELARSKALEQAVQRMHYESPREDQQALVEQARRLRGAIRLEQLAADLRPEVVVILSHARAP